MNPPPAIPDKITHKIHWNADHKTGLVELMDERNGLLLVYQKQVLATREAAVRAALIKLGWTPPPDAPLPSIPILLHSPDVSYWLKDAAASLMQRDPCDACSGASLLAALMRRRLNEETDAEKISPASEDFS